MNKLKDINWNHLYCFFEVAKLLSLKDAAKKMGVSSSTLSEQIKRLELRFERKLLNRSPKGLSLTIEGVKLYEHSRLIFEEGYKVLEKFSRDEVGGYSVNIGIEESFAYDISSEFVSQYWDLYAPFGLVNTLRYTVSSSLIDNIQHGVVDWGISLHRPKKKNFIAREIGIFDVGFYVAENLYEKFKDDKDIIRNIPLALIQTDKSLNNRVLKFLREEGISIKEKVYSDHPDFLKKICKRGRCVVFLPDNPLDPYKGLVKINFKRNLTMSLFALWKTSDEGLVSISKLKELINSKLSIPPRRYKDFDLQIEVSEVSGDLLK